MMHGRYHRNSSYPPPLKKEPSQKTTGTLDRSENIYKEGLQIINNCLYFLYIITHFSQCYINIIHKVVI